MVAYLLDFYEKIRFSKTLGEYQVQPYPLEKTTIVFLDPPKKIRVTFVWYSWNNYEIFLYLIFPEHYFGIFPGFSLVTFSEYSGNISWECSTNILRTYICPVGRVKLDLTNAITQNLSNLVAIFIRTTSCDLSPWLYFETGRRWQPSMSLWSTSTFDSRKICITLLSSWFSGILLGILLNSTLFLLLYCSVLTWPVFFSSQSLFSLICCWPL